MKAKSGVNDYGTVGDQHEISINQNNKDLCVLQKLV
jgi:hypothetical protein